MTSLAFWNHTCRAHDRCTRRERGVAQQADAADEPHGGWKDPKVAYLHLKSASQLIRGVGRAVEP